MYLIGIRHFVFMPVPSETFVKRGRQNAGVVFKGLTRLRGGRQWVFTQPACDALQVERDSWCYLATTLTMPGQRAALRVDGDKQKSRHVMA